MVVQHNITAMNSNRQLGITTGIQAKSSEKLSSGYKINRAADDAAGLAISEKMRRQVRGLTQASSNAQDGISVVQTAEGALNEVHDMLQRMNELATKAANDTLQSTDRSYIQSEVAALSKEITRTATATEFNNQQLLNGTFKDKNLQVGSETDSQNQIKISINKMSASMLGVAADTKAATKDGMKAPKNKNENAALDKGTITKKAEDQISVMTHSLALNAISAIKNALNSVSQQRSDLGAIQNRLEHTIKNLDNVVENTQSAESQIRDTDMATEMVKYSNNNILAQAGQSMLAQANQSNQGVLSLLG
jgi:flagellin